MGKQEPEQRLGARWARRVQLLACCLQAAAAAWALRRLRHSLADLKRPALYGQRSCRRSRRLATIAAWGSRLQCVQPRCPQAACAVWGSEGAAAMRVSLRGPCCLQPATVQARLQRPVMAEWQLQKRTLPQGSSGLALPRPEGTSDGLMRGAVPLHARRKVALPVRGRGRCLRLYRRSKCGPWRPRQCPAQRQLH